MNIVYVILFVLCLILVSQIFGKALNELCYSYGLYKMLKERHYDKAWLAFVPIIRQLIMGVIVDRQTNFTIGFVGAAASIIYVIGTLIGFNLAVTIGFWALRVFRGISVVALEYDKTGRYSVWTIALVLLGLDGWVLMFDNR